MGRKLHKTGAMITIAVLIAIAAIFVLRHAAAIILYYSYGAEATAVVTDVETRRRPFSKRNHREYRIGYVYYAGGREVRSVSAWVSYNHAATGQELTVRFDPDAPDAAMLEIERNDSAASLSAMAVVAGLVALVAWLQNTKRKLKKSVSVRAETEPRWTP